MAIDDSFKKPGAVPFSWEIRPGVPKIRVQHQRPHVPEKQEKPKQPSTPPPPQLQPPSSPFIVKARSLSSSPLNPSPKRSTSLPNPSPKLKPPPALSGLYSSEPRTGSFRSTPRVWSDRWLGRSNRIQPESVSPGCFPSPLLKLKRSKRKEEKKTGPGSEADHGWSDRDPMSPWSVSSRRSGVSPLWDSPKSSFSSYQLSPRFVSEAQWAGYGLF